MSLLQIIAKMKRIKVFIGFLLSFFLIAGCIAQKSESVQTAEEAQPETIESELVQEEVRQINYINIENKNENLHIKIQGNKKLVYTSIKQEFPFGIAIYLPETKIAKDFKSEIQKNYSISDMIVKYADKEENTAKIEILLKEDLEYEVSENDNILDVVLLRGNQTSQNQISSVPEKVLAQPETKIPGKQILPKSENVLPSSQTATLTGIEFNTMENGKSDIVVQTDHPVAYDIISEDPNKLFLNLYNTIIPDHHQRPILTHYFKSAVESLIPLQLPGKKKNSKIEINIREKVPYRVVHTQHSISLHFEPSTIEPPVFEKAKKIVNSGNSETEIVKSKKDVLAVVNNKNEIEQKKPASLEEEIFGVKKEYTGEKIKLDFYETDIKNVFRILRSVGGSNFAIDKNVEGKVTLTLEDPVPWDQVLDLVLKMNNLGQKREGNVIRIATLDTIKKEEKLVQDAIAARKKSMEQKKSFEPLVTEYIPINYSDADADIRPHIENILTKERGSISVDKRTNMIIVTDTQAKVDQTRELIYRLDQVTPQIMIEAKVVEVTKNFSRELGLGLSLVKSTTANARTNPDADFTVALNHPTATPLNAGSFNIYSFLGNEFLNINAQIAASETKGDVKVVSSPRIITLDNKTAKIKQGLEYAYLERDDTGGSSVSFKSIDLLLEVTPHVTPDKRIAMTVFLTKNDIDSVTNGIPSLSTNEAQTELLVNDKSTVVIGGIVKTTENKSKTGTPVLSGIPIIGRLFRTDRNTDNRTELLIFLTPSIVQLEQKKNRFTSQSN